MTVVILTTLGFSVPIPASFADVISGTITGHVVSAGASVPGVSIGSPVTGVYSYDAGTVNFNPIIDGLVNPMTEFSLSIGNNPFIFTFADIADNTPMSGFPLRFIPDSTPAFDSLFFFFHFDVIQSFVGGRVNRQIVDDGGLASGQGELYTVRADDPAHSFQFTFLATPVPEPSTISLFGITAISLIGYRWCVKKPSASWIRRGRLWRVKREAMC